ncbi:hypothetical protein [Candidatus Parabeggiatoa sp. HSG14]|uniref:hypothetical protein n=1 Tax=Candidatus Parabeggiatoa sp. HSG14 TaxID=3055593 RepID=UPI0025A83ED7|nr:hypothetical protein [Thiotrichales bacterium HSG14]
MLTELLLTQDEYPITKRWFQDDYFDLFTWQNAKDQITCFQLCYDRLGYERVISWDCERGFGHHRVDDGENSPHKNMTPVLIREGIFPYKDVMPQFIESSKQINQDIHQFVTQKLNEYRQQNPNKLL